MGHGGLADGSEHPQEGQGSDLITAAITTYRRPHLLLRAIASVQAQRVSGLRICVYDNNSGDDTESLVRRLSDHDPRVHYIKHAENIGGVANINFAFRQVSTPFFSILADDDLLMPGFYENALRELSEEPRAGFFCGRTVVLDTISGSASYSARGWTPGFYTPSRQTLLRLIQSHHIWTGIVWRREILESIGEVDGFGSDDNFMIKAAIHHPFLVSHCKGAVKTATPESYSGDVVRTFDRRSGADQYSPFLDYLIGRSAQLQADLIRIACLDRDTKAAGFEALSRERCLELRHWLLSKSFPGGRISEMETIRSVFGASGGSRGWAVLFQLLCLATRRGWSSFTGADLLFRWVYWMRKRKRTRALQARTLSRDVQEFVAQMEKASHVSD